MGRISTKFAGMVQGYVRNRPIILDWRNFDPFQYGGEKCVFFKNDQNDRPVCCFVYLPMGYKLETWHKP